MTMRRETFTEGIQIALEQLLANKFRSVLTILGIVVGVATVVTMSAALAGIRSSVVEGFDAAGPKNFIVSRFDFSEVRLVNDGSRPAWADNPSLTVIEAQRIAALRTVRAASIDLDLTADISAGSQRIESVQISSNDTGWSEFTPGTFVAGLDFLPADVRASRPVIVLSLPLAQALFGTLDPVGRTVRVQGVPFRVSGVFEMTSNVFSNVVRNFAIMPYSTAIKHLAADSRWMSVLVVTADQAEQEEAIDQVIALLRTSRGIRPGAPNNFAVIRQAELAQTFDRLTGVFFLVMIALSSVGLMVGGVGVIGIMMISVTERTREIGIRKALGATRSEILWQFLIEASTVTMAGAAIGLVLGGSAALLVRTLTPIPAAVPIWAVVASLIMAGVAGVLFGLWPAWRAAHLDPVEALRYE